MKHVWYYVASLFLCCSFVASSIPPEAVPNYYHQQWMKSGYGPFRIRHLANNLCVTKSSYSNHLVQSTQCSNEYSMNEGGGLLLADSDCVIPSFVSSPFPKLIISSQCNETYRFNDLCMKTEFDVPGSEIIQNCGGPPPLFTLEFTCTTELTGWHLHGEAWFEKPCIKCTCGLSGVAYCEELYPNGIGYFIGETCIDCDINKFASKTACRCFDDHAVMIRNLNSIWSPNNCTSCRCTPNKIECQAVIEGKNRAFITEILPLSEGKFFDVSCNPGQSNCISGFLEDHPCSYKSCKIREDFVKHGQITSLSFGGFPDCLICNCYHGRPFCKGNWKKADSPTLQIRSCLSELNCNELLNVADVCRHPLNADCERGNFNWTQDGCQYSCKNENFSFKIIEKPWCQKLVQTDFCASCGNRTEVFAKYGDMFTECTRTKEIMWKNDICDGLVDCSDGSDEQNCRNYFCSLQVTAAGGMVERIFWPRTPVNTTLIINCSVILPFWKGIMNRTCHQKPGHRSFFSEVDFCSCEDQRVFPFNSSKNVSKWDHMFSDSIRASAQKTGFANSFIASYTHGLMQLRIAYLEKIPNGSLVAESNSESVAESKKELARTIETNGNFSSSGLMSNQSLAGNLTDINITVDKAENGKTSESAKVRKRIAKIEQKLSHIKNSLVIEAVLGSISVLSCIVCLIMYRVLRVENKTKIFLHKSLFLSWAISYTWQIIGSLSASKMQPYRDFCRAYLIINHYWVLTVFTWMSLEGVNLLIVLLVVFQTRKRRHFFYSLVGWGLPLCITLLETTIFFHDFKKNRSCLGLESNDWLFKGPIAFLLAINFVILLLILLVLLKSIFRSARFSTGLQRSRATGKAFIVLLPLLGVTYVLGFFMQYTAITYLYVILNSIMGLLLAIFHFILDPTVQSSFYNDRRKTAATKIAVVVNRPTGKTTSTSNVCETTAM